MKNCILVLLGSLTLPCLAWSADVDMILSKDADNSLIIDFAVGELKSSSSRVDYNVYYEGDNYLTPTPLFTEDPSFASTPDMAGEIALDDTFIKETWVPSIQKYVAHPKIWIEYRVDGGSLQRSNILILKD